MKDASDRLNIYMKLKVYNKEPSFGPGICMLMHAVEREGSLSKACKSMEMAYSKAWRVIKRAEDDLGFKLLDGNCGGKYGGGTALTDKGRDFLRRYEEFEAAARQAVEEVYDKFF